MFSSTRRSYYKRWNAVLHIVSGTITTTNQEIKTQSNQRARYKRVQLGAYNSAGSTSQLVTHNQTSVEQGDVPTQLGQFVLECGPENTNSISRVCPTSSDYLQGLRCGFLRAKPTLARRVEDPHHSLDYPRRSFPQQFELPVRGWLRVDQSRCDR